MDGNKWEAKFPWLCSFESSQFYFLLLVISAKRCIMAKADLFPWLEMVCQFRTGPVGLILLPHGPGSPMYSQNRVCKSTFPGRSQWGSISQPLETSSTNLWKYFAGKNSPAWFNQPASRVYHLCWHMKLLLFIDWAVLAGPLPGEHSPETFSRLGGLEGTNMFTFCSLVRIPYNKTYGFHRYPVWG